MTFVQKQILTSAVKYYLYHPEQDEFIQKVLKLTTEESDNPDIRDRGFIYWRLLAGDLDYARGIVFAERPPISENVGNVEPELLDALLDNLGTLASVYYRRPEHFVPKIKQKANERFDLENVDEPQSGEGPIDGEDKKEEVKKPVFDSSLANFDLGIDEPSKESTQAANEPPKPSPVVNTNLLDF